jgi:hypothetical protein
MVADSQDRLTCMLLGVSDRRPRCDLAMTSHTVSPGGSGISTQSGVSNSCGPEALCADRLLPTT